MFVKPSHDDLRRAAARLGISVTESYLDAIDRITAPLASAYAALDALSDELPPVTYPRDGGVRPSAQENPLGAWYVKTAIRGRPRGKLKGMRVALKDNICLAGVPMMAMIMAIWPGRTARRTAPWHAVR